MEEQSLITKLVEKQGDLSDYAFAGSLGISQQLWQMTRTFKRGINLTLLRAIAKNRPDMVLDVLIFLGFDVSNFTIIDDNSTCPHQTQQIAKIGSLSLVLDKSIK